MLVVDDEGSIRTLATQTLEKTGLTVITAQNGLEAVKIFKKQKNNITAVLLDMTMPYMNGEETFRELRLIEPNVKVILSSGYNEREATSNFTGKGLAGFLQKPYRAIELIEKVREIIKK
jgi:two-component system cell cycle sensor histidine kinase/response regulator CckA